MKRDGKNLVMCALFLALLIVSSWIHIPSPVPFTLQTLVLFLLSYLLGRKKAVSILSVYVVMGLLSFPVFSGFMSGIGVFYTYRGGFLLGFFPLILLSSTKIHRLFFSLLGLLICHAFGILWINVLFEIPLFLSFVTYSLPFLIKDVVCLAVSLFFSEKIKKTGAL